MPLKPVLDTIEGLDEPIAALYTETDGKFVLELDDIESHPALDGLRVTIPKLRDEVKGKDAQVKELKAKIADFEKGAPDTAATQAKLSAMQEELQTLKGEADTWRGKYTSVTRDQALTNALLAAGIKDDTYLEAATLMVLRDHKVDVAEDGTVVVETPLGAPKLVNDFVKSFVAGKGAKFVAPAIGMGAKESDRGGATVNNKPVTDWTPAEKGAYIRENGLDKWKTLIAS